MKSVNVFYYIVDKNLENSVKLLKSLGYPDPKAKNKNDLKLKVAAYLADFYKRNKNNPDTIVSLASIHPDVEIIEKALLIKKSKEPKSTDTNTKDTQADGMWANCSACGLLGADAAKTPAQPASKLNNQHINMIIIGGSVILITGLIATIYFSNKK